jgi:hypothetical protein
MATADLWVVKAMIFMPEEMETSIVAVTVAGKVGITEIGMM